MIIRAVKFRKDGFYTLPFNDRRNDRRKLAMLRMLSTFFEFEK